MGKALMETPVKLILFFLFCSNCSIKRDEKVSLNERDLLTFS